MMQKFLMIDAEAPLLYFFAQPLQFKNDLF